MREIHRVIVSLITIRFCVLQGSAFQLTSSTFKLDFALVSMNFTP